MSNHATRLTYSAFDLKIWSIFHQSQIRKTAYVPRASDGFPRVLLHRLLVLPTSKVSPSANYNKFENRGQTSFPHFIVIRLRPVASAIPRPPLSKNDARSIPSRAKACQIGGCSGFGCLGVLCLGVWAFGRSRFFCFLFFLGGWGIVCPIRPIRRVRPIHQTPKPPNAQTQNFPEPTAGPGRRRGRRTTGH